MASSEVFTARINTPVYISLSSHVQRPTGPRLTSDEPSFTSSRPESCPKVHPTFSSSVRHGSLSVTVRPSISALSTRHFSVSMSGQFATSRRYDGHQRHSWAGDVSASDQHRVAPPRLPEYTDIELPPPPYNPDFLAPMSCQRWFDVIGRRSSSGRCPPPPPPSQRSSTSDVRPRISSVMSVIAEQCLIDNDDNDDDNDDDVFISEKRAMLGHKPETCS